MTHQESIDIIEKLACKSLMEELLFLRDGIERENLMDDDGNEYDLYSAFDDAYNQADSNPDCPRGYFINIREITIALGWYVAVSEEELLHTISFATGKPAKGYYFKHKGYYFKHKGVKYKFNSR